MNYNFKNNEMSREKIVQVIQINDSAFTVNEYRGEPETRSLPRPKQGSSFTGKERGLPVVQFLFVCFYLKSPSAAKLMVAARDRECSGFSGSLLRIIGTITFEHLSEQFFQELFLQALWFIKVQGRVTEEK